MSRFSLGSMARENDAGATGSILDQSPEDATLTVINDEIMADSLSTTQLAKEIDDLAAAIQDGMQNTDALLGAQDSLVQAGEITACEAEAVLKAVQMLRRSADFAPLNYSVESYSNGRSYKRMAVEGIGSSIKAFFAAIINAIKRFGSWIASFFTGNKAAASNGVAKAEAAVETAAEADKVTEEADPGVRHVLETVAHGPDEHPIEKAVEDGAVAAVMEEDPTITRPEAVQAVQEVLKPEVATVVREIKELGREPMSKHAAFAKYYHWFDPDYFAGSKQVNSNSMILKMSHLLENLKNGFDASFAAYHDVEKSIGAYVDSDVKPALDGRAELDLAKAKDVFSSAFEKIQRSFSWDFKPLMAFDNRQHDGSENGMLTYKVANILMLLPDHKDPDVLQHAGKFRVSHNDAADMPNLEGIEVVYYGEHKKKLADEILNNYKQISDQGKSADFAAKFVELQQKMPTEYRDVGEGSAIAVKVMHAIYNIAIQLGRLVAMAGEMLLGMINSVLALANTSFTTQVVAVKKVDKIIKHVARQADGGTRARRKTR